MKTAIAAAIIGLCAFASPAFAYTQNGTIPAGVLGHPNSGTTQIHLQQPIPRNGYVKLTVKIPNVLSVGIHYETGFCLGPTPNCPQLSPVIPGGQQITVIYESGTLSANGIWLRQPTSAAVPYILEVDYLQ